MLVAKENDQLVIATSATGAGKYTCPVCNAPVQFRKGHVKVAHFAHYPGTGCVAGAGETTEHLLGKQQIYDWLLKQGYHPQLEKYLAPVTQRPDILFNDRHQATAIEFQCSPLSIIRHRERNAGYQQLGINPIWILGQPYRRQLSCTKVAQFTQLINGRPGLWYWDTSKARLVVNDCYYRCSLIRRPKATPVISSQVDKMTSNRLATPQLLNLTTQVWQRYGVPLSCCPLVCHDTTPTWPATRGPLLFWRIQVVLWLADQPLFSSWSPPEWQGQLLSIGQGEWLTFPCLVSPALAIMIVVNNFTQDLCAAGMIALVAGRYVLLKHPPWFQNLGQKLAKI